MHYETRKIFCLLFFLIIICHFLRKFFASLPLLLLMMRDNKQAVAKDADDNEARKNKKLRKLL